MTSHEFAERRHHRRSWRSCNVIYYLGRNNSSRRRRDCRMSRRSCIDRTRVCAFARVGCRVMNFICSFVANNKSEFDFQDVRSRLRSNEKRVVMSKFKRLNANNICIVWLYKRKQSSLESGFFAITNRSDDIQLPFDMDLLTLMWLFGSRGGATGHSCI